MRKQTGSQRKRSETQFKRQYLAQEKGFKFHYRKTYVRTAKKRNVFIQIIDKKSNLRFDRRKKSEYNLKKTKENCQIFRGGAAEKNR